MTMRKKRIDENDDAGARSASAAPAGGLPALPSWNSGGALIDIADRDALYRAMEEEQVRVSTHERTESGRQRFGRSQPERGE